MGSYEDYLKKKQALSSDPVAKGSSNNADYQEYLKKKAGLVQQPTPTASQVASTQNKPQESQAPAQSIFDKIKTGFNEIVSNISGKKKIDQQLAPASQVQAPVISPTTTLSTPGVQKNLFDFTIAEQNKSAQLSKSIMQSKYSVAGSIASDLKAGFPQTKQQVESITAPVEPKNILNDVWSAVKEPVIKAISDYKSSFEVNKNTTKSELVSKSLTNVVSTANVLFTPFNALLALGNDVPVVAQTLRSLIVPFVLLGESASKTSNLVIDQLPISSQAKNNLKPAVGEVASLITQIAAGHLVSVGTAKAGKTIKSVGIDAFEKLTKNVIDESGSAKTLQLTPDQVREINRGLGTKANLDLISSLGMDSKGWKDAVLNGINVTIPSEKIMRIIDKPYWEKVKKIFNQEPTNKTKVTSLAGVDKTGFGGYLTEEAGKMSIPPKEMKASVEGSDLRGTEVGNKINDMATRAEVAGKDLSVDLTGQTGTKLVTPDGNTIGISIIPPKFTPNINTTSPEAPGQKQTTLADIGLANKTVNVEKGAFAGVPVTDIQGNPVTSQLTAPSNLLVSHEFDQDPNTIASYVAKIKAGKKIEPILVIREGEKYGIEDGKHRYEAYKQLGIKDIPIKIVDAAYIKQIAEVQRVADNLQKNNVGMIRKEAEAMAKSVIANRPFNSKTDGWGRAITLKNVEELIPLVNRMGDRTPEQIAKLKADIIEHGIQYPIELIQKADGTFEINDGKHRILIAKDLGITEIPTVIVSSELKKAKADLNKEMRGAYSTFELKNIADLKRAKNLKVYASGDIETLRKNFPSKVTDVVEAVRRVQADPNLTDGEALDIAFEVPGKKATVPSGVNADMGGYSDIKSATKALEGIKAIEFPELLRIYKTLTNKTPLLKMLRGYLGQQSGKNIKLSYEIFKNPTIAVKVFAHELGHLVDYFPDQSMKRGNLLGRIASLRGYLKHFLPEEPGGSAEPLTPQDRDRLRKEAKEMAQKPIMEEVEVTIGEKKATPEEILSIWNDTMAGEKMPELLEWIQRLSENDKVNVVKGAIKGVLPNWANFGVLIKEKQLREVIKNSPADIKANYQELVRQEVLKRKLFTIEEVRAELKKMTQLWKPFNVNEDIKYTKYRYSGVELYADALSVLFNDPALLKETAPNFYKGFFNYLDAKPEVKDAYFAIQDTLRAGDEAIFQERYKELEQNYQKGEDIQRAQDIERRNIKTNIIGTLNTLFNDKNAAIIDKVNKAVKEGKNISDEINPIYDLAGLNYLEGAVKEFVYTNFNEAVVIANKVENGWSDLGKILQLERALTERGQLANPLGYDPKTAQWTLDKMKENMIPDQWNTLQEAKKVFRGGMKALIDYAQKEGYWNPEMQGSDVYSTFQVLDYLDQKITSKIYQQKGTLKGIANPATSSLAKMVTTLRAIRYNKSKKVNLGFLKDIGELENAKTQWNGRSKVAVEPKDKDKALVTVVINGKMQGFYVDKDVGMILNHQTETTLKQLSTITRLLTQVKLYRPLFTSLNLGFQLFNFSKDFQRTWRNLPDKTLGDIIKSYPKLIGAYLKASPTAWAKALGKEDALIKEMETVEIFGLNHNDLYGSPDPGEEEVSRILKRIGILPQESHLEGWKKFLTPVVRLFDGIEIVGNYIEALPKVAGYNLLNEKMPNKELAHYVRNYIGSPDFLTHGTATPITNNLFLFSNAAKEGIKGDLNMAFRGKTRGAWWFKLVLGTIIPKLIQYAIGAGLAGTVLKKMLDNVSEYDKTNYDILPMGVDEKGQTIYIRMPKDETGRFYGALTWKFMNLLRGSDKQTLMTNLTDIFSLWSGQLPSLVPSATGASALITYLSGKNPYDGFRNRNVIPDTEFNAGFKYSFPIMLKWLANNQGASIVMPAYQPKGDLTKLEQVLNLPVLANLLGRFVKVSDYGQTEIDKQIKAEITSKNAVNKIRRDTAIDEAIAKNEPLDVTKALGHTPNSKEDLDKIKLMVKQLAVRKEEGKNVYVDNLIYATTNEEKVALLKRYKTDLTTEEFQNVLNVVVIHKLVSTEVIRDVFIGKPE